VISLTMVVASDLLQAQRVPSWSGSGVVSGIVRQSGLAPGRRLNVCALYWTGPSAQRMTCGEVDDTGSYEVDSLPFARFQVSVNCETLSGFGGGFLAIDTVSLENSATVRRDWSVSATSCDPRPLRRITSVFRGHYSMGLEESTFVPCPSDAWFLPGDSLHVFPYDARRAWATWSDRARASLQWPKEAPTNTVGSLRFYVRWRGTVVGPGHYGHMGVSPFEFLVDSVVEVRVPRALDCS
jgi:hypothetical protein